MGRFQQSLLHPAAVIKQGIIITTNQAQKNFPSLIIDLNTKKQQALLLTHSTKISNAVNIN